MQRYELFFIYQKISSKDISSYLIKIYFVHQKITRSYNGNFLTQVLHQKNITEVIMVTSKKM